MVEVKELLNICQICTSANASLGLGSIFGEGSIDACIERDICLLYLVFKSCVLIVFGHLGIFAFCVFVYLGESDVLFVEQSL